MFHRPHRPTIAPIAPPAPTAPDRNPKMDPTVRRTTGRNHMQQIPRATRLATIAIGSMIAAVACAPPTPSIAPQPGTTAPSAATGLPSDPRPARRARTTTASTRCSSPPGRSAWEPMIPTRSVSSRRRIWARLELRSERPAHEVTLTSGYWIDTTEVTNAAFADFVADGGYATEAWWSDEGWSWLETQDAAALPDDCVDPLDDHPRVCITWFEAEAYAAWRGGSLPTEAQWEYAARGPDSRIFPWGDEWDPTKAWIVDATESTAVGSLPEGASWVGALDMSGNAMEWVADWWRVTAYEDAAHEDPTGPALGSAKVEKGGWWGAVPYVGRSAYRHFEDPPTYRDHHIGVRVVSPADPT